MRLSEVSSIALAIIARLVFLRLEIWVSVGLPLLINILPLLQVGEWVKQLHMGVALVFLCW